MLLTAAQASAWASDKMGYTVTPSNITYLVNYGLIPNRLSPEYGLRVAIADLEEYYAARAGYRENAFKQALGQDLNWRLSFEEYKESETTKHVHRLHPYKGKFIPQLVEYFIDTHIDEFKTEACFQPGDIILDPFCGSGTTLVQANESGINAIGVDVSLFNTMISNLKLAEVDLTRLADAARAIEKCIEADQVGSRARNFEADLLNKLGRFNATYFPRKDFRRMVRLGHIDEDSYGQEKADAFLTTYAALVKEHNVCHEIHSNGNGFVGNWYHESVRSEIEAARRYIERYPNPLIRDLLLMILSRTARSSRATTHADLATLIRPVTTTYYCGKHSQVCKPLFSMLSWWKRYSQDTIKRIAKFNGLRTDTRQICLVGDSRTIDLFAGVAERDARFGSQVRREKIRGIFSSPPYVGMIDYHEQHAYAYELFDLPRNDAGEIGPMSSGKGRKAREAYIEGIAAVLSNCQRYMVDDYDVFIVANDKFGLYPQIAFMADMEIVKEYKRPVLNRAEGDKGAYSESIFHMKRRRLV